MAVSRAPSKRAAARAQEFRESEQEQRQESRRASASTVRWRWRGGVIRGNRDRLPRVGAEDGATRWSGKLDAEGFPVLAVRVVRQGDLDQLPARFAVGPG